MEVMTVLFSRVRKPALLAVSCCLLFLSGCTALTLPGPQTTVAVNAPGLWESAGRGNQGRISTGWLDRMGDRDMEKIVNEALKYNPNLLAAAARLRVAREGTIIGRAARLPRFGVAGSGSRSRVRTRTDTGPDKTNESGNYGLSLNASWEVDLWGRLADLDRASRNDYMAALADFRGARLSLAANTAKAWCNLITAEQQLKLAEKTRDSFESYLRITERSYKAGDITTTSALNVQFGRNNVASAERVLVNRRLGREEAARNLELLLGRYPAGKIPARASLPVLSQTIPVGLPSELLMRRPDLVAAAAVVQSSARRADAARKSLLPSLSLSGGGSTSTNSLGRIIADPETIVWNVAASLAQSVYDGGAPSARARAALAQNEIAIRNFSTIALRAFREVESALATERSLVEQEQFLVVELRQANLAERQAIRNFSDGIGTYLEVLEGQRRAVSAGNAMISLRNARIQNRIDLHLALGGDFKTLPRPERDG